MQPIDVPTMSDEAEPEIDHIVQLLLFKIGNKKIEEKYKERLKQLKVDHKAIASIDFKMLHDDEKAKETQSEIVEKINQMIKSVESEPNKVDHQGLTNIPFFDILFHNISSKKDLNSNPSSEDKEK